MVVAIIVAAFWVALFLPVVILPFLPKVETSYAPAPRQLVQRSAQPVSAAQHERAA